MKERGIIFSGAMVRAILSGAKTQTRRVVKPAPQHGVGRYTEDGTPGEVDWVLLDQDGDPIDEPLRCPYGAPGDRLWVRETWAIGRGWERSRPAEMPLADSDRIPTWWRADGGDEESWANRGRWRPAIHMPRWASRITLEITEVRVQRLQDISEEDALAEGVDTLTFSDTWLCVPKSGYPYETLREPTNAERAKLEFVKHQPGFSASSARDEFMLLWDSINGERAGCAWRGNPWVWALTFKRALAQTEAAE